MTNRYCYLLNYRFPSLLGSSFNDKPINGEVVGPIGQELFEKEQDDLLMDLIDIPKKACDRQVCSHFIFYLLQYFVRTLHENPYLLNILHCFNSFNNVCIMQINEFVKRARAAKIHAYIISHLKKEMPAMMGKAKAQQRLIDNLEDEFAKVSTSLSYFLSFYLFLAYVLKRQQNRFKGNSIYQEEISQMWSTSVRS